MRKRPRTLGHDEETTPFSLSVGDLMGALLLIFVLALSATLLRLQHEYAKDQEISETYQRSSEEYKAISAAYKQLADTYRQLKDDLYEELRGEFEKDLDAWQIVVDRETLAIRFQQPEVLFAQGEDEVTEYFKDILEDFFPRYIKVLSSETFRDQIEEIRIEGHTSSEWETDPGSDTAYFKNMELSQNRTRNVLKYSLDCLSNANTRQWVRAKITANGLSSSKLITRNGKEDKEASRRVEFRVRTSAEQRIAQILRLENGNARPKPETSTSQPVIEKPE